MFFAQNRAGISVLSHKCHVLSRYHPNVCYKIFVLNQITATRLSLCWGPRRTGRAFFLFQASFTNAALKLCVGLSHNLELSSAASFALNFRTSRKAKLSQKMYHFTESYEVVQEVIAVTLVKKFLLFHEIRMFWTWL